MPAIGFRCYTDGFSYVVLDGTQTQPVVIANSRYTFPKDLRWSAKLSWLRKQIIELLGRYDIRAASIKAAEPVAKSKSLDRSEVEGVVKEAVFSHLGIECKARIKSQIRRDIYDFDQPARYLERVFTAVSLENLNTAIFQEATLVAITELEE
jgi:hypothetical protein